MLTRDDEQPTPPPNASLSASSNSSTMRKPLLETRVDGPRAWLVVLGAFLVHLVVLGSLYGFGIYVLPLAAEFGMQRAEVAIVGTINLACFQGFGIIAGPLSDKYGSRRVMIVGIALWTAGQILASFSAAFWHVVVTLGVISGVGTSLTYFPAITVVPQWFDKFRGTATSFAVLGSGIGNLIFALAGTDIVTGLGWRHTLQILGGVGFVILLVAFTLVERRLPRQSRGGLFSVGIELMKTREYRAFLAATFIFQFAFFIPFVHIVPYAVDHGVDAQTAALCLAFLGVGSSVGRLVWGPLADAYGRLMCFRLTMFLSGVTMALWPACTTGPSILAFAFFYAFFSGGFIALSPLVSADMWGAHRLGGTFSLLNLVMIPGSLSASTLAGLAYDKTGSYDSAIFPAAACLFITAALLMLVRPKKTPETTAAAAAPQPGQAPPQEGDAAVASSNGSADVAVASPSMSMSPQEDDAKAIVGILGAGSFSFPQHKDDDGVDLESGVVAHHSPTKVAAA